MIRTLKKFSSIVHSYKVTKFEQFGHLFKIRVEVELIDGSKLFIRETIIGEKTRKYAYHWQKGDGELLVRWDNAPDWEISTFPHHKHTGRNINVEPSHERTLEQVLQVIAARIEKSSSDEN
ncbi:MAG: hypothetical protein C4576_00295 [Desulfobacteraceae bacterium]|nr:MAG: hypothetical protein C4576_00295 [Desulfobacteraceae bacterium]